MPYPPMRPVRPSVGPTYVRCPICQQQVASPARRTASGNQVAFSLAVALARHKRDKHSDNEEDDA